MIKYRIHRVNMNFSSPMNGISKITLKIHPSAYVKVKCPKK